MHAEQLLPQLRYALAANNLPYTAVVARAAGDEIELHLGGAPTGLDVLIGDCHVALQELSYNAAGELNAIHCHRHWDLPTPQQVARGVVNFLMARGN